MSRNAIIKNRRNRSMVWVGSATGLFGALAIGNAAQAQTLISATVNNGGFETPVVSTFQVAPTGATWTFGSNAGIARSAYNVVGGAAQGSQYAFLQVGSGATQTISQTFTLSAASNVALTFALAGRSSDGSVAYGGNTTFSAALDTTTVFAGSTTTNSSFTTQTATTTQLAAGNHTITFTATGLSSPLATDNTALLDNVNLTAAAAAPEPGALALIVPGMLGVAGMVRRRKSA